MDTVYILLKVDLRDGDSVTLGMGPWASDLLPAIAREVKCDTHELDTYSPVVYSDPDFVVG